MKNKRKVDKKRQVSSHQKRNQKSIIYMLSLNILYQHKYTGPCHIYLRVTAPTNSWRISWKEVKTTTTADLTNTQIINQSIFYDSSRDLPKFACILSKSTFGSGCTWFCCKIESIVETDRAVLFLLNVLNFVFTCLEMRRDTLNKNP